MEVSHVRIVRKKSQNCRVIQNDEEGLKEGLKKQCIVGL